MQTVARLFSAAEAPPLWLPTGRLVACDPLTCFEPMLFEQTLPPGHYPVCVYWVPDDEFTLAYAELRVRPGPVVRWEPALTAGQDPATLGPGEQFGYPVDTGLGCFLDAQTLGQLPAHEAALRASYRSYFDDFLAPALLRAQPRRLAATLPLYPGQPDNLAVFGSGDGDGTYATYLGRGGDGQPVRFVTEFLDVDNLRDE